MNISEKDKKTLRQLAEEYVEITKSDTMYEITTAWYSHNNLERKRPMVLFEDHPMHKEIVGELLCEGEFARDVELGFRSNIWHFYNVKDDKPLMPYLSIKWEVPNLNFGGIKIEEKTASDSEGRQVAHLAVSPIKNLDADLAMLKRLDFRVDENATYEKQNMLNDCFGDILPTVIRGRNFWTMGLTIHLIKLIGMENFYMAMYDHPDKVHYLMNFLMEEKLRFMKFMEENNKLTLNNEGDYYSVGSYGFTHSLPQKDYTGHVRTKDISVMLESQETSTVSPSQYEEFVFPYYMQISKEFGRLYYGCCEPMEKIWPMVKKTS